MTEPEEPSVLMDPDDEFEPAPSDPPLPVTPKPKRRPETVGDLEIPPGARTVRNLRDSRRVIE